MQIPQGPQTEDRSPEKRPRIAEAPSKCTYVRRHAATTAEGTKLAAFWKVQNRSGQAAKCLSAMNGKFQGICMPRVRSTFTKRQKEHTRQQRQRDKAERRNQRKQEKAVAVRVDQMAELGENAATPAAPFKLGAGDVVTAVESTLSDRIAE